MRNEIYRRIRQNKMKYYAELKNSTRVEISLEPAEDNNPRQNTSVDKKLPREKNVILKKVQEIDYKTMFKKIPLTVKTGYKDVVKSEALNRVKIQVVNNHKKIRQFNAKVNRRIDKQSDKLAQGIYNVSSLLFEETDTDNKTPLLSTDNIAVETIGSNTIEWSVPSQNQPDLTIHDRLAEISERTAAWIKHVPQKINTFLLSDNLPDMEGMNLSQMK
jgi:hypothetical protein